MNKTFTIHTDEYFDGEQLHTSPTTIQVVNGNIHAIRTSAGFQSESAQELRCGFLAPGLVDAHCHLFLDGAECNLEKRKAHLSAGEEVWLNTGRENLLQMRACGITLLRDAGDRWGINHRLRTEAAAASEFMPKVRSAGKAIRRKGRYGNFMADEVDSAEDIAKAIAARTDVDDFKILLTGIIDFAAGQVKGAPQFDADMLTLLVEGARRLGIPSFAHCSGLDGLRLAAAAGVDSIEHGFFMNREVLDLMAARKVAWTPTWSPVAVMTEKPELLGLDEASLNGLHKILDNHRQHLALAPEAGVTLIAGSDAGSCGVPHGHSLIGELEALQSAGLSLEQCLSSATSAPRRSWGIPGGRIAVGEPAEFAGWDQSPRFGLGNLRQATLILRGEQLWQRAPVTADCELAASW